MFTGVKVFSATKAKEREELGENVTRWLKSNSDLEIVDRVVRQSSDNEFHCFSLTIFYKHGNKSGGSSGGGGSSGSGGSGGTNSAP